MMSRLITLLLLFTTTGFAAMKEEERIQKLAGSCTAYGFEMFGELGKSDASNVVFSPYSTFSCLSMVCIGARSETATQLRKLLHLSFNRLTLPKAAASLAGYLKPAAGESYALDSASGMWLDRDTFVLADYLHAVEEGYKAQVQSLDFAQTEKAVSIINEWTRNETGGRIEQILEADDIDSKTRLVLTNAIYFEGSWLKPFDPKRTANATFQDETNSTVQMMEQTGYFPYMENETCQLLSLPFASKSEKSKLACLIFLPQQNVAISDLEGEIVAGYADWVDRLKQEAVEIKAPRFCARARYLLNEPLQNLGVQKAFMENADFSGIDGMHDLSLTKVIHETLFSFYETGVSATSASAAALGVTSAAPPKNPYKFIADRPFIFMLIDLKTKLPLFIGKIQDATTFSQCE